LIRLGEASINRFEEVLRYGKYQTHSLSDEEEYEPRIKTNTKKSIRIEVNY